MKWLRLPAAALFALLLALSFDAGLSSASAQLGRQAPQGGRPPIAAPTGAAPEAAALAAPEGTVNAALVSPNDEIEAAFTPVGLFLRADFVVKSVLLLLVFASFWSWVIIVDKAIALSTLKRRSRRFEQTFWSGRSLDELYTQYSAKPDQPMAAIFVAALREWRRSFEKSPPPKETSHAGVKDRVEKAMNVSIQRETEKVERGLSFLATVGSTAPFVGLFGTVWGIMNSFQAIAVRQDTTLAVVAPGIAEALFATALGLLAAIPAVIAYNRFVNELGRLTGRLEAFADEFSAFLSRQLDERSR
jgi:biopolymer transport protein TolQ